MTLREAALEKALELDNTLAEAHAALAGYRCWGKWDWEGAEKEFQQTFKLSPNDSLTHSFYSHFLCCMGHADKALPHIELALELDPLNPLHHAFYGIVLVYNRRYNDAMAAAKIALDIVPKHGTAITALQMSLFLKGMYDELLADRRQRMASDPERLTTFEYGFEEDGFVGAHRALADLLEEWYGKPGKRVKAWGIACRYLDAGDYDLAIDWLEKAYKDNDPSMPYIGMPIFETLHSYPRYQDLLRKMNLPVDEKE
jgi:serine/threonine-protein kinase